MTNITLAQFCNQWTRGEMATAWHSLLAKNAENFVTLAGEYAKKGFQSSFDEGGLYGSGKKWEPRTSKWGKKFTHPVMIDSGELKRNIKGDKSPYGEYSTIKRRDYRRRYSYNIWTEEKSQVTNEGGRKKRGKKNGRYKSYAAVNNTDPALGLYTVCKNSSKRPVQRPFIGHSPKLLDEIEQLFVPDIFKGFP